MTASATRDENRLGSIGIVRGLAIQYERILRYELPSTPAVLREAR